MVTNIFKRLHRGLAEKLGEKPGHDADPDHVRILDQVADIRKAQRKQAVLVESLRSDILEKIEALRPAARDIEAYLDLAQAYFYLDRHLASLPGSSQSTQQASDMVWDKLEAVLAPAGIELIRRPGAAFDPRLHEAIRRDPAPALDRAGLELVVTQIIQPGYMIDGKVLKPAKAAIGHGPAAGAGPDAQDPEDTQETQEENGT